MAAMGLINVCRNGLNITKLYRYLSNGKCINAN